MGWFNHPLEPHQQNIHQNPRLGGQGGVDPTQGVVDPTLNLSSAKKKRRTGEILYPT